MRGFKVQTNINNRKMKNNIRVERAKIRISQKELANHMGTTQATITSIENNKSDPKLSLAMRIAHFFGIKTDELFELEDH